jgi:hypothetical protein
LLPDDWDHAFLSPNELELSTLESKSPDLNAYSEDVGGPHANVYYTSGVLMTLHILQDDSATRPPFPDLIRQQYEVYREGIPTMEYVFTEPSTVEGEMRAVQVYKDGLSYLLRFAYADDTYREVIDFIISNFNITPETFYPNR